MTTENEVYTVSVIMPAYNAEKYIRQAMESVIGQTTNEAVELIVVDDCSTDRTSEIVNQYKEKMESRSIHPLRRIVYLQNERNSGVAESRNHAIRLAKGIYIAFLDADDWWDVQKLEKQLAYIRENHYCNTGEEVVLCCTGRELMEADGRSTGKCVGVPTRIDYDMMLRTNHIPCSSVLLRTDVALAHPMCHDELHEDYILWLQLLKKYDYVIGLDEPMLKSRLSEGGKSRNKLKSAKMQYGVYRYMGYGTVQSLRYLCSYMVNGVRKYKGGY